jgi:hypothetical protein
LYGQVYVDEQELLVNIRKALQTQSQISLRQLTEQFPLHKGLAEVVSYLNLAARDGKAVIVEDETDSLYLTTHGGQPKQVCLPRVIFVR